MTLNIKAQAEKAEVLKAEAEHFRASPKQWRNNGGEIMSITTFILIVGLVLLTMSAISDAIALLKWMCEQDQRHKQNKRG